ncbi:50S ribosomal protein L25 [Sulfuricaulis limicola]|uniref:Large ribosomal subunit protein bL25 n=1 Tax=Sulfuricaulis limicola TaxID=1620215 RepID=A0A1B4XE13_9GAMM|nr:50S ribosomal protein L25/general stress protein Ctc [Sulfuricaulis limicola]BAV33039.1 50S ribosomal protein L25 [Sulfuricaulis limicola]
MSAKFELTAEPRSAKGTGASRRLRRSGKVPAVLYGAGKQPTMVALDHNLMSRHLANEKFHTSILTVTVGGETDQAILRDFHMHPYKPIVMHVDLQRISATEKIHMKVPIHFVGGDVAPGVKIDGGVVTHLMNDIDITCLPKDLPEFLTADLSALGLNESVHLKDLKLPEGVAITSLTHGGDNLAVAAISMIKEVVEEAPVVAAPVEGEAAAAAPAEGEAKAGEAKAGETKKGEAPKADAKKPEAKKPEAKKEGK